MRRKGRKPIELERHPEPALDRCALAAAAYIVGDLACERAHLPRRARQGWMARERERERRREREREERKRERE
jgi:hypothetical protein